jgi:ribosomal protein S18 acetylase RimI-like enzyme
VSRLATRGLIAKRASPGDARARAAQITAKGKARLAVLDRDTNRRLTAWLASKPAAAVGELVGALHGLYGASARVVLRGPRPGTIGHIIARHAEIYTSEFGYRPEFEAYVVEACHEFLREFSPPRDRVVVAERAGRFLGSVAVKGLADQTSQLRFLILDREARGLGIGRRLVRCAVDHARAMGDRRMMLETASDLTAARALYAAHGFRQVSRIRQAFLPAGVYRETWELDLTAPTTAGESDGPARSRALRSRA